MILKKCPQCSAVNADSDTVCGVCGVSLANATPATDYEAPKVPSSLTGMKNREELIETGAAGLFHECPFCHKHFSSELVSRDSVDASELAASDFPMVRPPSRGPNMGMRPVTEVSVTFRLHYRCKHCGKEWTRISTEHYTGE